MLQHILLLIVVTDINRYSAYVCLHEYLNYKNTKIDTKNVQLAKVSSVTDCTISKQQDKQGKILN